MEWRCFICGAEGANVTKGNEHFERKKLTQLLVRICKLFKVTGNLVSERDFVTESQNGQQQICCIKCCDLLAEADRLEELIRQTEKKLKSCLNNVETLVTRSEAKGIHSSFWGISCLKFREHVIKRGINQTTEITTGNLPSNIVLKQESDEISKNYNSITYDQEDHYMLDQQHFSEDEPLQNIAPPKNDNDEPYLKRKRVSSETEQDQAKHFYGGTTDMDRNIESLIHNSSLSVRILPQNEVIQRTHFAPPRNPSTSCTVTKIGSGPEPARKHRKVIVIAEEDEDENECISIDEDRSVSFKRTAKGKAEDALKCLVFCDSDQDDQDYEGGDNIAGGITSAEESSEDEDSSKSSNNKRISTGETKGDSQPPQESINSAVRVPKKKSRWKNGDVRSKQQYAKFYRIPFIVAREDVYIYNYGTFVRKTYTHLQCLAHKCTYQAEFDFYSSFQLLRKHIEDNHRSRKHRQKAVHPCVLCNILLPNKHRLRNHLRESHADHFDPEKQHAVCECCLMFNKSCIARYHAFKHKSAEEKAAAKEIGDGNKRCFVKRRTEKEITEKNYICDWGDCTAAFKTNRSLSRHKQSHLPMDQRSDVAKCPECGLLILKESFNRHMETIHHPERVKNVKLCPICDKRFHPSDGAAYEDHLRRHRNERPFMCYQCGTSFVNSVGLASHVKHVHEVAEPTPCQVCGAVYTKPGSLAKHIRVKHPELHVSVTATKMRSKFYYDEELERLRKENFIGPILKYPCSICDVVCGAKSTLQRHMLRKHQSNDDSRNEVVTKRSGLQRTVCASTSTATFQ